ncbi:hypothetical protein HNY73_022769 [Argiope bruennichi]|uniref:Uncharacterized protein n=1 Tax=Argiope bruennichi TaxID=94029 RepID=A0A8T0E387_ARGBR|nr:hypothetical protein HNY73_022769 [Argiope bruennichi]
MRPAAKPITGTDSTANKASLTSTLIPPPIDGREIDRTYTLVLRAIVYILNEWVIGECHLDGRIDLEEYNTICLRLLIPSSSPTGLSQIVFTMGYLLFEFRTQRFAAFLEFLQRYSAEGNVLLSLRASRHRCITSPKKRSMCQWNVEWRHTLSPVRGKKSKVPPSEGKVVATVIFSIAKELSTPSFRGKAQAINAKAYCETLRGCAKLWKKQRREKLSKYLVLLHDNARPQQG